MKSLTLLLAAALFIAAAPPDSNAQEQTVSIELFYETLAPHGDWTYVEGYGYCWQPFLYIDNPEWRPYVDGYWAHTEAGWTWITDEPFGWATYHYGRWINLDIGWCWVPGTEWAPAWVSWRQADQHVGWAPLPPEARWTASVGFSTWTDAYYGIGPSHYNFVPLQNFCRRSSYRPFIVNRSLNFSIVDQSVNITHISYNSTVVNNIFVGGPDLGYVERFGGGGSIHRLSLQRDSGNFYNDWNARGDRRFGHDRFSRIDNDRLIVAAPVIGLQDRPLLPELVRNRIERPSIDRGWRNAGDDEVANRLRDRLHEREAHGLPRELPDRRPALATSDTPPPAVGRPLSREERVGRDGDGVRPGIGMGARGEDGPARDRPTAGTPGSPLLPNSPGMTDRPSTPGIPPSERPGERADRGPGSPSTPPTVVNPADRGPGVPPSARPLMPGVRPPESTRRPGSSIVPPPSTRPSDSSVRPPDSSKPSSPQLRPPPTTRPSGPMVRPPDSSRRPGSSVVPPPSTRPSIPSVRPPSSARPSSPQMRPPSSSKPSTPSVRPPSSARPSSPQMRPPSSSKPSSARPSAASRPSSPQIRPPSRPKPSAPKISSPSKPKPAPSVRPSSSSRPATKPQVSRPSSSRPSASSPRPSSNSRPSSKKEDDRKPKGKK